MTFVWLEILLLTEQWQHPSLAGYGLGLEKVLLTIVKPNALLLGAGLAVFGLLGTSAIAVDTCKKEMITGEKSTNAKHCRGDNHMFSENKNCICPNPNNSRDPNQEFTKKCYYGTQFIPYNDVFTCEKP